MMPLGVVGSARAASVAAPLVLTYRGFSDWSGNPLTFPIGEPSPSRQVIVQVSTAENAWLFPQGVQIGGVDALKDAAYASPRFSSALYRQAVPDGTTVQVFEKQNSYGVSFIVWTVDRACELVAVTQGGSGSGTTIDLAAASHPAGFAIATHLGKDWQAEIAAPFAHRATNSWSKSADAPTPAASIAATYTTLSNRYAYLATYGPA